MKQPPLITPREVDVPRAQRHTLPNGASLYAIPSDDFEVLRFTFVFRAGSSMQHAPFAASATANMLSEGSRDMTARQIAERLDFHGSYFEVNVDRDYVYISFSSLSKFFGPTLEVAEQILLQPLFPEDELRAYCEKRKQTDYETHFQSVGGHGGLPLLRLRSEQSAGTADGILRKRR